jgi:hypothetical protein
VAAVERAGQAPAAKVALGLAAMAAAVMQAAALPLVQRSHHRRRRP